MKHIFKSLSYESFITFYENLHTPVMITTPLTEGKNLEIIYVNHAFEDMTGYDKYELLHETPKVLQGKLTDQFVMNDIETRLAAGEDVEGEVFNYTKNGKPYRVHWDIYPLKDDDENILAYVSYQRDVTPEYLLLQHRKLFQKAIDQSTAHIALFDTELKYIYANKAYIIRTGYTLDELLKNHPRILKSGEHNEDFYDRLWDNLKNGVSFEAIFINKDAHGFLYHELQTITPIQENGEVIGFMLIGKNYDKEIDKRHELITEGMTDTLTGLLNRKVLDQKLNAAVENYIAQISTFSMLFIDIDNFKQVNDKYGHDKGDEVLKELAQKLQSVVRKSDDMIRYGGDEFICLLYGSKEAEAKNVVAKMKKMVLEHPLHAELGVDLSIGYSEYRGEPLHSFIKKTDHYMYEEKLSHKTGTKSAKE